MSVGLTTDIDNADRIHSLTSAKLFRTDVWFSTTLELVADVGAGVGESSSTRLMGCCDKLF